MIPEFTKDQRSLYEEVLEIAMTSNDMTQSDLQGILELIIKKYQVNKK